MQKLSVRYRPEAIADLDEIYQHIDRISFSPETALGLVGRVSFLSRCQRKPRTTAIALSKIVTVEVVGNRSGCQQPASRSKSVSADCPDIVRFMDG